MNIINICLLYVYYMFIICLLYVYYMFIICLLYIENHFFALKVLENKFKKKLK